MASTDDFDLDDLFGPDETEQQVNGPKQLRKAFEKIQKELKVEREKNATYEAEKSKSTITDLAKSKGLPEKIVALYKGESTPEAFEAWATEYADIFGLAANGGEGGEQAPDPNAELRAAHERMTSAISGAQVTAPDQAAQSRVAAATTKEELYAALAAGSSR